MSTVTYTSTSPRRRPAATLPALLLAVLLVGVAVVGVHDLITAEGWTSGRPWLGSLADELDGRGPTLASTVVGVLVALLGLALLWTALRPARRTHQATPMDDGDVWISKRAVARLAEQAAERTTGIESARVDVRRRAIVVKATTGASNTSLEEVHERVEHNVGAALDGFSNLRVKVRSKEAKDVT